MISAQPKVRLGGAFAPALIRQKRGGVFAELFGGGGGAPEIDLFVIAGQSNAEGRGDSALSPAVPAGTAYEWTGSALVALADPVGGALSGSAWPAFANAYYARTGRVSAYVECAQGGSAQDDTAVSDFGSWDIGGTLYGAAITRAQGAVSGLVGLGYTVRLRGVLWAQGERDAAAIDEGVTTLAQYKDALVTMIPRWRTDLAAATMPFWIFQTGRGDTAGWVGVRNAQVEVALNDPYAWLAFNGAKDFASLHYTQAEYNQMGTVGGTFAGSVLSAVASPLVAGTASATNISDTGATLIAELPTGGSGVYLGQWQVESAPGSGVWSDVAGEVELVLELSALTTGAVYSYRYAETDQLETVYAPAQFTAQGTGILDTAVAYWRAADYSGSGDWLDSSGNGHAAAPVGVTFLPHTGSNYVNLPGTAGNTLTKVSDSTVISAAGDYLPGCTVDSLTQVTDAGGEAWTVARSTSGRMSAIVDRPKFLLAVNNYFQIADHPDLNFGAGQDFTVAIGFRTYKSTGGNFPILAKRPSTSATVGSPGWVLYAINNPRAVFRADDGTTVIGPTTLSNWSTANASLIVRNDAGTVRLYADGVQVGDTATLAGDLTNTDDLRIGRLSGSGTVYIDMEIWALAIFKEAVADVNLADLHAALA